MEKEYSFHSFLFPFRWNIIGRENDLFSSQINLDNIHYNANMSDWERVVEPTSDEDLADLYNEKGYFYEFVHDALYDTGKRNSLVRHYERVEPKHGHVRYVIEHDKKCYSLHVEAINLNFYSTGVGVLSFYLKNCSYSDPADVLNINQYGRRLYPPFINDVTLRFELADAIGFEGLNGVYKENFANYNVRSRHNMPADFVLGMIHELAPNIDVKPVIDDRMYVLSWYKNDDWANDLTSNYENFLHKNYWYEYVYVDKLDGLSCQNDEMCSKLIKESTYPRWQKCGTVYGASRYSLVCLAGDGCPPHILHYFETEYVRMAELVLVQRASVLRFSAEVTGISELRNSKKLSERVGALYKEYIRFVNQIHFREVSAQDQAIEIYNLLYNSMGVGNQVEKLDNEIEELHSYVGLHEDRNTANTMSVLTWVATICLPASVISGIFGMNHKQVNAQWYEQWNNQILTIVLATIVSLIVVYIITKHIERKIK